jgi:hypothetical protein
VRKLLVATGLAGLQALSCGGDTPICPNGNCTLPGRTTIKWTLDHYPEWLFPNDSCLDMGASKMRVDITGIDDPTFMKSSNDPMAKPPMQDPPCSDGQYIFIGLPAGSYNVAITPLDDNGTSLVNAPATGMVAGGETGADTELDLNVPYTAWSGTYTGTFLFRISWGGMTCGQASPPVVKQVLKLSIGGVTVNAMTDMGQNVDGTDPKPCRELTEQFAQYVQNLPFGPATFEIKGTDENDAVAFQHQFDTFVGADKNNPTITFDVPAPDAGVDAAVDAPID